MGVICSHALTTKVSCGVSNHFTHESFQPYFTIFVLSNTSNKSVVIINKYLLIIMFYLYWPPNRHIGHRHLTKVLSFLYKLVGGYVRYISPYIIIILLNCPI